MTQSKANRTTEEKEEYSRRHRQCSWNRQNQRRLSWGVCGGVLDSLVGQNGGGSAEFCKVELLSTEGKLCPPALEHRSMPRQATFQATKHSKPIWEGRIMTCVLSDHMEVNEKDGWKIPTYLGFKQHTRNYLSERGNSKRKLSRWPSLTLY